LYKGKKPEEGGRIEKAVASSDHAQREVQRRRYVIVHVKEVKEGRLRDRPL
jgi:hypothetical protein